MFALTWPFYTALGLFVGWGLALAALLVVALAEGRAGLRSLLRRYLLWRVPFGWYLVALAGPLLIYLVALALYTFVTGATPDPALTEARALFGPGANVWLLALPFLIFDALANGEELAWRGLVLPRLQARSSALLSSLLLGAIWGVWHLPKFWATPDAIGIAYAMLHTVLAAVLYTWVFNGTGGSLLLVTLLHAAYNT
ncbi:MAG: CPBP family intramembrane metalloprotease, partial [Anaerolineae bacterium]|nr:CPBP family intramembrane metalloprotease [Anaerolineae bacterium]